MLKKFLYLHEKCMIALKKGGASKPMNLTPEPHSQDYLNVALQIISKLKNYFVDHPLHYIDATNSSLSESELNSMIDFLHSCMESVRHLILNHNAFSFRCLQTLSRSMTLL